MDPISTVQATALLEEATHLAASSEVRKAVEQADPETLARLYEEQRAELTVPGPGPLESETTEWEAAAPDTSERE